MKILSATCLVLLSFASTALGMDIVRNDKSCAAIVVPDKALPIVQFAAEELQHHIQKASGVKLEIVPESKTPAKYDALIYVGECEATKKAGLTDKKLPLNAYRIKLIGPDLFFYGDDNGTRALGSETHIGTISAVYEFLETKLGVRWLWPGELGEYVPKCKDIAVEEWDKDYRQRFTSWDTMYHLKSRISPDWGWSSKEMREQRKTETETWLRRQRYNKADCVISPHYFTQYWKRFGKTHPEYFAMLPNGERRPLEGDVDGRNISMCVSEPMFWKQIVDDWKNPQIKPWFEHLYGDRYICCSENDTPVLCTCQKCRSWDAPDPKFTTSPYWSGKCIPTNKQRSIVGSKKTSPSLSDRMAKYYLAVQTEAQKVNPDVIVCGYAYWNYASPPKQTKLNDHIQISIVPHFMYPVTDQKEAEFRKMWDGWRKTGARLVLRPNFTGIGHNMPISFARRFYSICTYAAKRGMIGGFYDSLLGEWAVQGPSLYVMGRVMVRPELPLETILGEYYAAFGPAGDAVKRYFDYWESVSNKLTEKEFERYCKETKGGSSKGWLPVAERIFTPEVMEAGRALLEKAKTTPGLSEEEADRVAFLDKGLTHAEMTLATLKAANQFKKSNSAEDRRTLGAALKTLYAFRNHADSQPVSNMGYLYFRESGLWNPALATLPVNGKNAQALNDVWKFRFDPEENGHKKHWPSEGLDDSSWDDIRVDSCWEKQKPGKDWKAKYGKDFDGVAWYRTRFTSRPRKENEQVFLLFGAVDEACVIYLNGKPVHKRGFDIKKNPHGWNEPFEVEVTDHIKFDGENHLAVRVEDRAFNGGVWKPVYLVYRK